MLTGGLYAPYKVKAVDAAGRPVNGARVYAYITQTVGPSYIVSSVEALQGFGKRRSMDYLEYYGPDLVS
jgi:hypothetical protein